MTAKTHQEIINTLSSHKIIFESLFSSFPIQARNWKPDPKKWSLLEVLCHLYDEEIEDFRTRTKFAVTKQKDSPPQIRPEEWVKERAYANNNFDDYLKKLIHERQQSVEWLKTIPEEDFNNSIEHPVFGKMSGNLFLSNWLAHDFLHFRQILKLKYQYLEETSQCDLRYAGNW